MKDFSINPDDQSSGRVSSSQKDVHPNLLQTVQRHLQSHWSQPLHGPSLDAYRCLKESSPFRSRRPFILDSGCGTGKSTQELAGQFPDYLVLGVDRSRSRLAKSGMRRRTFDHSDLILGRGQQENCILLRAELATFWRLLAADGYVPHKHFLLYPNPWPKPSHLKRRWHGHPVFPCLLALGGEMQMRCNWEIYALEFAQAASLATGEPVVSESFEVSDVTTPFEKKYFERQQRLFSVTLGRDITDRFRRCWRPPGSDQA